MARGDRTERNIMTLVRNSEPVEGLHADAGRLDDAAGWHVRLRRDAAEESTWIEFAAWLESDTENRAAFDLIEDLYFALEEAEPHLTPAIDVARTASVVSFTSHRPVRRFPVRAGLFGMGLIAASLLVVVGIRSRDVGVRVDHYATAIGEKRSIALADGSLIDLNTGSAITVSFTDRERKIVLENGEGVFRVGKDTARPFHVVVGDRDIRDIGTIFNVLSDTGRIVVTVAAGKVSVAGHNAADLAHTAPVNLAAGDQLMVRMGQADSVRHIDPAIAMAWREGYLTYKEAPLSSVVSDLNRYFRKRIVLRDIDTEQRRFSGAIKVDDEEAVVSRLAELLPLMVDRSGDGVITLRLKTQKD